MNKITKQHTYPKAGDIYENDCGTYILGEYDGKHFLTNLQSGSTWNGFKSFVEETLANGSFTRVTHSIELTPES